MTITTVYKLVVQMSILAKIKDGLRAPGIKKKHQMPFKRDLSVPVNRLAEQDSQAIQYTSEFVNDTILKYIKTAIIFFG